MDGGDGKGIWKREPVYCEILHTLLASDAKVRFCARLNIVNSINFIEILYQLIRNFCGGLVALLCLCLT